ncbi:MAG: hypothetical protein NTU98_06100 [Bacteroidetes bacterium]|nr:hypothetical protein [Bacteroidota bacterium]
MKATTIILAAVLTLSINALSASNDRSPLNNVMNSMNVSLAPSTPSEATFEDITYMTAAVNLAPVTPSEADFSDAAPEPMIDFGKLAPVTPGEADFSDEDIQTINTISLAPVTPAVADFNDSI